MDRYSWNDKTSPYILCHSSILLTIAYHAICFMMRLRFVRQMKYREIAAALNISEVAVYKHLSQGIQKLKQHFNP